MSAWGNSETVALVLMGQRDSLASQNVGVQGTREGLSPFLSRAFTIAFSIALGKTGWDSEPPHRL